jgi:hypothetical protein
VGALGSSGRQPLTWGSGKGEVTQSRPRAHGHLGELLSAMKSPRQPQGRQRDLEADPREEEAGSSEKKGRVWKGFC